MSRLDSALIFEQLAMGCTATTADDDHSQHGNLDDRLVREARSGGRDGAPELVMGQKIGSYCLTEPGAGSDAAKFKNPVPNAMAIDYVLNGSKMFISALVQRTY